MIDLSAAEQPDSICHLPFPSASNRTKWWFPGIRTCTSAGRQAGDCYSADCIQQLCSFFELMSLHSLLPYSTGYTWATLLSRKTSDMPSKFPPRAFIFTVPFARSAGSQWSALFLLTSYPGIVLISLCKITTPPSPFPPPDACAVFSQSACRLWMDLHFHGHLPSPPH